MQYILMDKLTGLYLNDLKAVERAKQFGARDRQGALVFFDRDTAQQEQWALEEAYCMDVELLALPYG